MHKGKVRSVLMQAVERSAKPEGDWNLNFKHGHQIGRDDERIH